MVSATNQTNRRL